MSSSTSGNNEFRCNECGITFTTVQDKEEHMKLEHRESKGPAGVKWAYNAQSTQGQGPTHTSSSFPYGKNCVTSSRGVQTSCLLFLAPQMPLVLSSAGSESFTHDQKWTHTTYVGTDWPTWSGLCQYMKYCIAVIILYFLSEKQLTLSGCTKVGSKYPFFYANITSPCYPIISAIKLLFSNK